MELIELDKSYKGKLLSFYCFKSISNKTIGGRYQPWVLGDLGFII